MAKLQFIKGAITGKLGEFVGAKWKGINYIRTYTKPANPKTQAQMSIRLVFAELSAFASALFALGFHQLIPQARRMTERNSVFRANAAMLSNKAFVPANLLIAKPNLAVSINCTSRDVTPSGSDLHVTLGLGDDLPLGGYTAHTLVYDTAQRKVIGHSETAVTFPSNGSLTTTLSVAFPNSSSSGSSRFLIVVTAQSANGGRLISATANTAP